MYNLRITHYPDGDRVRIYKVPLNVPGENPQVDISTGEIISKPRHKEYNPFTDQYEVMRDLSDPDLIAQKSMSRTMQHIYHICRSNQWEWFVTLTFNPEKVDSFNYDECTKRLSKWLNNIRSRQAPDLKYVMVPELHKSGRFHFHGLWSRIGSIKMVDSGKRDKGQVIYNIGNYKLGFTTATIIRDQSRVAGYVSKYITKDLCAVTDSKKRYWASRNLDSAPDEYYMISGQLRVSLPDLVESKFCRRYESDLQELTLIDCYDRFNFPTI